VNAVVTYLEVRRPQGVEVVPLDSGTVTIGRADSNDVVLDTDGRASRMHALLERFAAGWCVRDLSSRNGTFVNGNRVTGDRPLHPGDEIRVGTTALVYRVSEGSRPGDATIGAAPPPQLTPREREVLFALLRPVTTSATFTQPASTREIAAALHVTEAAVKQHLLKLYDKFRIYGDDRRVRLANEAIERGAISLSEIRADP
jgi:pSer/pThr/pTyr-binding forkhead associated (FHA) protein